MTALTNILETKVGNQRTVKIGDDVKIKASLSESERQSLQKLLGKGELFLIASIIKWPCGKVMVYVKTTTGQPGIFATDLE